MKREELKEHIKELKSALNYGLEECDDINQNTERHYNTFANAMIALNLIDEYTKPKTKKNINATTRLRNKDRRETRKL